LRHPGIQWTVLVLLSVLLVAGLTSLHLPAALLLGPIGAGILFASNGVVLRVPRWAFLGAQGVIGCMIVGSANTAIGGALSAHWPLFLGCVLAVIAASAALGWLLARWRVLPGTTAVWGSSPGAATTITLMAGAFGADVQLVAFMQYLRVVLVAGAASVVVWIWAPIPFATAKTTVWFPMLSTVSFVETVAIAGAGAFAGSRLRIPAGALLVPLGVAAALRASGAVHVELPPWLLAASYTVVGWSIGLGFTRAILTHVARIAPRVAASVLAQITMCAGLAWALTRLAGIDPLTAYLATSPGAADSVAIIAASSKVDVPFVVALQGVRLILVILIGPALARFLAQRTC